MEKALKPCVAEIIGTFALCFIGAGSICVAQLMEGKVTNAGLVGIALGPNLTEDQVPLVVERPHQVGRLVAVGRFATEGQRAVAVGIVLELGDDELASGQGGAVQIARSQVGAADLLATQTRPS